MQKLASMLLHYAELFTLRKSFPDYKRRNCFECFVAFVGERSDCFPAVAAMCAALAGWAWLGICGRLQTPLISHRIPSHRHIETSTAQNHCRPSEASSDELAYVNIWPQKIPYGRAVVRTLVSVRLLFLTFFLVKTVRTITPSRQRRAQPTIAATGSRCNTLNYVLGMFT